MGLSPMPCLDFTLFIYLNTYPSFFDKYACNMYETKSSDKISSVSLYGENPKANVDEENFLLILLFGVPFLLIVFVFLKHSHDVHINLSCVS